MLFCCCTNHLTDEESINSKVLLEQEHYDCNAGDIELMQQPCASRDSRDTREAKQGFHEGGFTGQVSSQKPENTPLGYASNPLLRERTEMCDPQVSEDNTIDILTIQKTQGQSLGIGLETEDGSTLFVSMISDGLINDWNADNPKQRLARGDRILEVNDISTSSKDMLLRIKRDATLQITRERPISRSVVVNRDGRPLGLNVLHSSKSTTLVVENVQSGIIADWNELHQDIYLKPGDRIYELNGCPDSREFLKLMKSTERLEMMVYSYSKPIKSPAIPIAENPTPQ